MKTLIAEDVLVIRKLLERTLSQYGHCDVAVDGQETVSKFKKCHIEKEPYNLLCLDILMPNKDGLQVVKEIREYEKQKSIAESNRIKVIMTTGMQEENIVSKAIASGCDSYMIKPIQLNKLIDQIKKFGLIE